MNTPNHSICILLSQIVLSYEKAEKSQVFDATSISACTCSMLLYLKKFKQH